jgi:hypothetical protein
VADEEITEHIMDFLSEYIDSVEQLQVLLLLHSSPKRIWTLPEISAELRSSINSIEKRLEDLYSRRVLTKIPELKEAHTFHPASEDIRAVVEEIAEQNRIRSYRLIEAIYSRPSKALRAFADAFKFGGKKK